MSEINKPVITKEQADALIFITRRSHRLCNTGILRGGQFSGYESA